MTDSRLKPYTLTYKYQTKKALAFTLVGGNKLIWFPIDIPEIDGVSKDEDLLKLRSGSDYTVYLSDSWAERKDII